MANKVVTVSSTGNIVFRTKYGPHLSVSIDASQPELTKQSFKDECDINIILANWQRTGMDIYADRISSAQYADVSDLADYKEAINQVRLADSMFMSLPSSVRAEFDNDPVRFVDFCNNPDNSARLVELGLAVRRAPDPREPVDAGGAGASSQPVVDKPLKLKAKSSSVD